jgi:tetratricopeptide (TPR) repeat protein
MSASADRPSLDATVRGAIARAVTNAAARETLTTSWAALVAREDDQTKAVRRFSRSLRREKHGDLVRALAGDLAAFQPPHAAADALAAELFVILGDQSEALRIAQAMRVRFPHSLQGPRLCLEAQLELGMAAEAEAVLRDLPPAAAETKWAVRAREALAAGAVSAAAATAPSTPGDAPKAVPEPAADAGPEPGPEVAGEIATAQSLLSQQQLDAAEAAIAAILQRYPHHPPALRLGATVAEQRGNLDQALERWSTMRARAPRSPLGYVGALRCLRRFGRLDLTAPVLEAGRDALWDNAEFVAVAAQTVAAGKVPEQAEMWWQRAMTLVPDNPQYALSAAVALSGTRKGRRQRLPKVLARLEEHHTQFPDFIPAYAAHIDALRMMDRLNEAESLSAEWRARFPDNIPLALARAGLLEQQERFDDALADISALHARLDASPELEAALIRTLSCAGRHDEAEQRCAAARAADPRDRRLWAEYARLASRRGDWQLCADRLREGLAVLPGDDRLTRELRTVRSQLAEAEPEAPADATDNVFARFESLGGSGMGCEFGMVQRKLGSDTVGLLRWARTNAPELISALNNDFEGVGSEEHTILTTIRFDADREEYVTRDSRYAMESHTFVRTSDAPADRMYTQTCRRLRFLRGKMLEDLRVAEKIFVYRAQDPVDDATVGEMAAALRRHGDAALLCVMRAPEGVKAGSVRSLGRGQYIGYVGHFQRDGSGKTGSDVEGWSAVCRAADRQWRQDK